jgi:cell division protein FtsI (penicillin-binding protein 3)
VIYDRNNNELAISVKVDSVFAVPDEIDDPQNTAKVLSSITGVPKSDVLARLNSDKSFQWIKRRLSTSEATAIRTAKLSGIHFLKEDQRFYPKGEMAAHVLGYVNFDGEGGGGLEYKYNDSVRGQSGHLVVMTDARGHRYDSVEQPTTPGANLVTTIDENIQYVMEKEVREAEERTHAQGISAVAMDPHSGEILAMANYPTFNPNRFNKFPAEDRINRAVNSVYEPGSTFKVLTIGAALEENLTRPDELIDCLMGSIVISGHRIHDSKPHGLLTVSEVLAESSDVGAIKLGLRLGDDRFYEYVRRLGFGRPTGIDLPAEEGGLTKSTSRWSGLTLASMSMGQEVGVTPLQILRMISAVANGGILYRPFVVKRIQDPHKGTTEIDSHGERVLSAETAAKLRPMMEGVVTEGTARTSKLEGYTSAGKTGTAQKVIDGHYSKTKYWGSFAGFAPASDPQIAIIVVVDEAVGLHQGGQVAAPVFKRIAEQSLRYLSVPSDIPSYGPQYTLHEPVPPKKSAPVTFPDFPSERRSAPPAEPWKVVDAAFKPSAVSEDPGLTEIVMPDFYGKSLRQVTEESIRLGLHLRSLGSRAAVQQFPTAGTAVQAGTRVQVRFASKR